MLIELWYTDLDGNVYKKTTESVKAPPREGEYIIKKNVGTFKVVGVVHRPDESDFNHYKRYSVIISKSSDLTNY